MEGFYLMAVFEAPFKASVFEPIDSVQLLLDSLPTAALLLDHQ